MSHTAPPTRPVANLPVWETVAASYRSVLQDNLQHLPRAVVGPLVLSIVISLIESALSPSSGGGLAGAGEAASSRLSAIVFIILGTVPYVLFGVAWHRLVLLGPKTAAPNAVPRWERRHWLFFAYSLVVATLFTGIVFFTWLIVVEFGGRIANLSGNSPVELEGGPALMAGTLVLVGMYGALVVMMRLSFVFPALAVDERYGLGDAWRHTQGQGLRLLAAVILASLPFALGLRELGGLMVGVLPDPGSGAGGGAAGGGPTDGSGTSPGVLLLLMISVVVSYIWTAIIFSLLSIAFRTCSGWIPDTGGSPGGNPPANLGTDSTEE